MRLLLIVSVLWIVSEIAISILKRSNAVEADRRDRRSIQVIWLTFSLGAFLGGMLSGVRATRMPAAFAPYAFYGGLALILLGCVIRWIAIATLKRYFTVDVAIAHDHKVIQHGLYSVVRHPSYSGSLLSFAGLGFAFQNWLSVAACITAAIIGLSYRIAVEEEALTSALGDEYRAYAAKTKRLIPGVF